MSEETENFEDVIKDEPIIDLTEEVKEPIYPTPDGKPIPETSTGEKGLEQLKQAAELLKNVGPINNVMHLARQEIDSAIEKVKSFLGM